jgi:transcriptional regulator with XRE-family HTH domain
MATSRAARLLSDWRKTAGLSQGEAAKRIGISQPVFSGYETGRNTPRTVRALKIAEITEGSVPVAAWGESPPVNDDTREAV